MLSARGQTPARTSEPVALTRVRRTAERCRRAYPNRNDAIVAARVAGYSLREIADAACVTYSTVRRVLDQWRD